MAIISPGILPMRHPRLLRASAFLLVVVAGLSGAAAAGGSVKSIMRSWKQQDRHVSAMLNARHYDKAAAMQALAAYAAGADDIAGRIKPRSAAARDIKARFQAFSADAKAAETAPPQGFRQAYLKTVAHCGACHHRYAN